MTGKKKNIRLAAVTLVLCLMLAACDGGGDSREGRNQTVTPSPEQIATPTVSPAEPGFEDQYLAMRIGVTQRGDMIYRVTEKFSEDGTVTESVTDQVPVGSEKNADAWEITEKTINHVHPESESSGTYSYENGVLKSLRYTTWNEDGSETTRYSYYPPESELDPTEEYTDYTDSDGVLYRSDYTRYGEYQKVLYCKMVWYREEDSFATPLKEVIYGEEVTPVERVCPGNRFLEATDTLPFLAIVEEKTGTAGSTDTANVKVRKLLVIGSFQTELTASVDENNRDQTGSLAAYTLAEPYGGCTTLDLYYSGADEQGDLLKAVLSGSESSGKYTWERQIVERKRVSTDSHGSYRKVDVHTDGTEVVRYERTNNDEGKLVSKYIYDSKGVLTSSMLVIRSKDGFSESTKELVLRDNGKEISHVVDTKFNQWHLPVETEEYTMEGSEIAGRQKYLYKYDENGCLLYVQYTTAEGKVYETYYDSVYNLRTGQ